MFHDISDNNIIVLGAASYLGKKVKITVKKKIMKDK